MPTDKTSPAPTPLEKATAALKAAQERFALREKTARANAERELADKLRNFDLYVDSVVDAKLSKVLSAKTDRKRNRIRDDANRIREHYDELREQMIQRSGAKAYKKPLYLIAAEEKVKALTPQ